MSRIDLSPPQTSDFSEKSDVYITHKQATIGLFGIRHHGPGSAAGLLQALQSFQPDCILIEGPADANDMLHWLSHPGLRAPIALLIYNPDTPNKAATFPFAHFSPEFQALQYGFAHNVPAEFFDLPQSNMMAADHPPQMPDGSVFTTLAKATGHRNYEQWWNVAFEQRQDSTEMFAAILELMTALRAESIANQSPDFEDNPSAKVAEQREAFMRRSVRTAVSNNKKRIAVVCGAWHTPALLDLENEAFDNRILANMPEIKLEMAWIPWTYSRLGSFSGYGAGIPSPGWYQHLWQMNQQQATPTESSVHWLTKVSNLLRAEDIDTSSAHVIETVRLADALAAMRDLPFPGLPELNEAVLTVMCSGNDTPMRLIHRKLTVGERMGLVPPDSPMVPLQRDLYRQQAELKLEPDPNPTTLHLDLRKELDLKRSHLLHRLSLLKIPWGEFKPIRRQTGTYQEMWKMQWRPDFAIRIVEANLWGNTIVDAASNFAQDMADKADRLPVLTKLLNEIILADLPEAVLHLMNRIEDEAALSSDVPHMMEALPPLARILRYGNVRNTDQDVVQHVVDGLMTRICIGLPSTCASLDDNAADEMVERLTAVHTTAHTLQNPKQLQTWQQTLMKLVHQDDLHGLLAGKVTRLLLDDRILSVEETAVRMEKALSFHSLTGANIEQLTQMAAWVDGFLKGSGLLLLHDKTLWELLDNWLTIMDSERFQNVLPLLRRTFSSFSEAERNQLNELIRPDGRKMERGVETAVRFNEAQADMVLPLAAQLLGLTKPK